MTRSATEREPRSPRPIYVVNGQGACIESSSCAILERGPGRAQEVSVTTWTSALSEFLREFHSTLGLLTFDLPLTAAEELAPQRSRTP